MQAQYRRFTAKVKRLLFLYCYSNKAMDNALGKKLCIIDELLDKKDSGI